VQRYGTGHLSAGVGAGLSLGSHLVQGGTELEPLDLVLVEGVVELDVNGRAIRLLDVEVQGDSLLEGGQALDGDLVKGSNLVVIGRVSEGQGQKTLLLAVGLVDTGKGLGDNSGTSEVTNLQGSVLAGRSLTVVLVTDNNPRNVLGLVVTGNTGNGVVLTSQLVLDRVDGEVLRVEGTDQHVVGDVVQVTTELEPGTSHGDVISRALALDLDQDGHVVHVLAIPLLEGLQKLKTVGGRGNLDGDLTLLGGRSLVGLLTGVVTAGRELVTVGVGELEGLAIGTDEGVLGGIEGQVTSKGHGSDNFGGGDEGVGLGVSIVTSSEVTVVGGNDGVLGALGDILTIPLTNAGTASVGKNDTAGGIEHLHLTVTLNGGANLLGTGGDGEDGLALQTVVQSLLGNGSRAGHILVGGVGAGADQTDLELGGPVVGNDSLLELAEGSGKIGGEGTVDVGLQGVEVNLDDLIVVGTGISLQVVLEGISPVGNVGTGGGLEVVGHARVVGEDRGGGTNLSTHVADGGHTSAGQGVNTGSEVLDDGTGTTLDSEDTSNLQDDILGGGPASHLSGQLDTDDLGALELPGNISHDIDGISSTDTDGDHTETTGVGGVRVSSDHQTSGEGVVLENDLVNNTRAGVPETKTVLGAGGGQEVVNLLVDILGAGQILGASDLGLDQMVAVDGGGDSDVGETSGHELEQSHLSTRIIIIVIKREREKEARGEWSAIEQQAVVYQIGPFRPVVPKCKQTGGTLLHPQSRPVAIQTQPARNTREPFHVDLHD